MRKANLTFIQIMFKKLILESESMYKIRWQIRKIRQQVIAHYWRFYLRCDSPNQLLTVV